MLDAYKKRLFEGMVRHALTTAGGYLVAANHITEAQAETLVGGAMVAIGLAWSLLAPEKKG